MHECALVSLPAYAQSTYLVSESTDSKTFTKSRNKKSTTLSEDTFTATTTLTWTTRCTSSPLDATSTATRVSTCLSSPSLVRSVLSLPFPLARPLTSPSHRSQLPTPADGYQDDRRRIHHSPRCYQLVHDRGSQGPGRHEAASRHRHRNSEPHRRSHF